MQKPRRLIYITHWRFPSEKTMTPLILKTCEGFVKKGYEVELWVPRRRNESTGDPFSQHGVETRFPIRTIYTIDLMHLLGRFGFLLMVATFNMALLWRLRGKPDVVLYGHDLRDFILSSMLRLPLFIEIHDFYESRVRFLNKLVLNRTTGLIVTNSIKQRRLTEAYGYPAERMLRQPNAVNVAQFDIPLSKEEARHQLNLPPEQKIALYTGHLFGWKGVYTLAEAAAFLPSDVYIYFVGGTEADRAALMTFVQNNTLPRITFLPHLPHAEMPLYLKAADVLVLPNTAKDVASKFETSPVKLFEYLASGTPIVASDLPSLREVVSEKEVLFFEPDVAKSLANAIVEVIDIPAQAEARSFAAQSFAKGCSWESRSDAIDTFLRVHGV